MPDRILVDVLIDDTSLAILDELPDAGDVLTLFDASKPDLPNGVMDGNAGHVMILSRAGHFDPLVSVTDHCNNAKPGRTLPAAKARSSQTFHVGVQRYVAQRTEAKATNEKYRATLVHSLSATVGEWPEQPEVT